jgi:esterase/lipase
MRLSRENLCFILLPGFAPDTVPVQALRGRLEALGYAVMASNFWGEERTPDFPRLTAADCHNSINALVKLAKQKFPVVIGIGISLGGALLIEHAKHNSDLDCIVSVGTPFRLKHKKLMAVGFSLLPIIYPLWKVFDSIKALRLTPIGTAKMIVGYLETDFLNDFYKITTPVLLLHSQKDEVTDYKVVGEFSKKFVNAHTKVMMLGNGNHVINYDAEMIINGALSFLLAQDIQHNTNGPSV